MCSTCSRICTASCRGRCPTAGRCRRRCSRKPLPRARTRCRSRPRPLRGTSATPPPARSTAVRRWSRRTARRRSSRGSTRRPRSMPRTASRCITKGRRRSRSSRRRTAARSRPGSRPYLVAEADPYDTTAIDPNHDWTAQISAAALQAAYPAVGTVQGLQVTSRDGAGDFGGRILAVQSSALAALSTSARHLASNRTIGRRVVARARYR